MSRIMWLAIVIFGVAAISYIAVAGPGQGQEPALPEEEAYLPLVLNSTAVDLSSIRIGGPRAASALSAEAWCDQPGRPLARLTWQPAEIPGSEQRVELTVFDFQDRELQDTKPLPPDQSSLTWENLSGQAGHHWRVLTLHEEGWFSSEISSFEGPTCVGPTPQPSPPPVE